MHRLEGLLQGIAIDGVFSDGEREAIAAWVLEHDVVRARSPFCEVLPYLEEAVESGEMIEDVCEDVLWVCQQLGTDNQYFGAVASDLQRLKGVVAGIAVDGEITAAELQGLEAWLANHGELETSWPYDELSGLVRRVLADGRIDADEHKALVRFFEEVSSVVGEAGPKAKDAMAEAPTTIDGICAANPKIHFEGRVFCFTGECSLAKRTDWQRAIRTRGGRAVRTVSDGVDYLVVGAGSDPCWKTACYGRRVEQATKLRRQGHPILVIREADLQRAVGA